MKILQISELSSDQLDQKIDLLLEKHLEKLNNALFNQKTNEEYLTRKEVADMLKIELSTLHNWCKKGKLKPYGIGNRVYFLRSDIEKALKPLNQGAI